MWVIRTISIRLKHNQGDRAVEILSPKRLNAVEYSIEIWGQLWIKCWYKGMMVSPRIWWEGGGHCEGEEAGTENLRLCTQSAGWQCYSHLLVPCCTSSPGHLIIFTQLRILRDGVVHTATYIYCLQFVGTVLGAQKVQLSKCRLGPDYCFCYMILSWSLPLKQNGGLRKLHGTDKGVIDMTGLHCVLM